MTTASGAARALAREQTAKPSPARHAIAGPQSLPTVSNLALQQALRSGALRRNLTVGRPDDPAEAAADRIADQLTKGGPCACGGICANCDGGMVRRQSSGTAGASVARAAAFASGNGRPLSSSLRSYFEPRLGSDLSAVRVHTDRHAATTADEISANAFTVGNEIGFAAGRFAPETTTGRWLLAHELAHTLQNSGGVVRRQPAPAPTAQPAPIAPPGASPAGTIPAGATPPGTTIPPATQPAPAPQQQKTTLDRIKEIDKDTWIAFWQESELERLWNSFGPALPSVVAQNRTDWDRGIKGGANLWQIPTVQVIQDRFLAGVAAKALSYLVMNRKLAEQEQQKIGIDPNAAPTAEQSAEVTARRDAAQRIVDAERAMAGLRTTLVGYEHVPGRFALFHSDCHPIGNKPGNRDLGTVHFDPRRQPELGPQGDEPACGRMPSWDETNTMWQKMNALIDGETARFPTLYALNREFREKDVATEKGPNAADAARKLMLDRLAALLANINDTEPKLAPGGELLLKLNPVHQQLFAEPPWKDGFDSEAAHARVDQFQSAEFWKSMGLGTLSAALFVLASLATAGLAAAVLLGAAAGVSGGLAINSWQDYLELQAASQTNLSGDTALVSSGQATAALMTAVLDTVFAFLDTYQAARGVAKLAAPLARAGESGERAVPLSLQDATEAETRAAAGSLAEIEAKEATKLSEALRNGAGREITDEALRNEGYLLEVELVVDGERHVYRQAKDLSWCRFSVRICGFQFPGDIARLAEGARRGFEHPLETVALHDVVTSTAHNVASHLSPARIAAAKAQFPLLAKLTPGAIERVVGAAWARDAMTGTRRLVTNWPSAMRGQLMEEIAAARVRSLLANQPGREALGVGHLTGEPIFIEGSRIRDLDGAQLTDGIVAVQRGDRLEIVAVLESKAGPFAAGGLTESLGGLTRASTSEIVEAIRLLSEDGLREGVASARSGVMGKIYKIDPVLWRDILDTQGANLVEHRVRLSAMRQPLMDAIARLPEADIKLLRQTLRGGEGQVTRDMERLLKEGAQRTLVIDGKPVQTILPQRPSFLGAMPSNLPAKQVEDISEQLSKQYSYKPLPMDGDAVNTGDLYTITAQLKDTLGEEYARSASTP